MWRAFLVFGVASVACWTDRAPAEPAMAIGNHVAAPQARLAGAYWCTITEEDFAYPRFACAIRDQGGHLVLAKLAGSVRFDGDVVPEHGGFRFTGRLYCPWGDCTQALHGVFVPDGAGTYRGTFSDDRMIVELGPAAGGTGYGGAIYGGAIYGGATYGNFDASGRRNRRP